MLSTRFHRLVGLDPFVLATLRKVGLYNQQPPILWYSPPGYPGLLTCLVVLCVDCQQLFFFGLAPGGILVPQSGNEGNEPGPSTGQPGNSQTARN